MPAADIPILIPIVAAAWALRWSRKTSPSAGTVGCEGERGADARTIRTPCRHCEDVR